jgi:hypothetical protein
VCWRAMMGKSVGCVTSCGVGVHAECWVNIWAS